MTTTGMTTIGELRTFEEQGRQLATQLFTGLSNAVNRSSAILAEGAQLSALEARVLANKALETFDNYQRGLMDLLENGSYAESSMIQQQRDAWIETLADLNSQGNAVPGAKR